MIKNENLPTTADSPEEKQDAFYSEELSRAAVGRLFDADEEEDSPPPIKSAFVSGFERASAKSADENPTKKRELPPRESNERFKPAKEEPKQEEKSEPEEQNEEPSLERHRRRETATTRMLNNAPPEENPEREPRERNGRRRNPAPRPAVRVNVEHAQEENSEEDLDSFRRRYNSGELVSPPRNTNRPVRPGGRSDVRTNRVRAEDRDAETISPIRMIIAGVVLGVLVLVTVLTMQLISVRNNFNEAQDTLVEVQASLAEVNSRMTLAAQDHAYELTLAQNRIAELERRMRAAGIDPDAEHVAPGDGVGPGEETNETSTPAAPELPTTHTVLGGENLGRIARRYYPGVEQATAVSHIQRTNNITNPNNIQAGQVLQITPLD
jgi:hypothetical protein